MAIDRDINLLLNYVICYWIIDRLCGPVAELLAGDPQVPGSIPDATRFSEYQWVWNVVHSALVRINEELLERKVAAPV
jgi:hypothetical protein